MKIKKGMATVALAGAAVAGGVALSTPANAATGSWHYYTQFSGTSVVSQTVCLEAGAAKYHTTWKYGPSWWQVGYVTNWSCYGAGNHTDLELYVS